MLPVLTCLRRRILQASASQQGACVTASCHHAAVLCECNPNLLLLKVDAACACTSWLSTRALELVKTCLTQQRHISSCLQRHRHRRILCPFSMPLMLTSLCARIRFMKLCHTRQELARLPQGPKLVLATLPSLQAGMARDLFVEWAHDPKNLILFTQQAEVLPCTPIKFLLTPGKVCNAVAYTRRSAPQRQLQLWKIGCLVVSSPAELHPSSLLFCIRGRLNTSNRDISTSSRLGRAD